MSLKDRFYSWLARRIGAATTTDKSGWFVDWARGGGKSLSGMTVNNTTALSVDTVFACIRNIAEDVAKIPFIVYQSTGEKTEYTLHKRQRVPEQPVYKLLHSQPNPEMTAMSFRSAMTAHCLAWGNGYAEIERNRMGVPVALWLLRPDRTKPYRDENGRIWYEVTADTGEKVMINADDVLHIPGLGFDGIVGYNVIRYARESIGLAMAAERFGATFFGNGSQPSGSLEHPANLTKEAQDRLIKSIEGKHQGVEKAHRILVLEEGMKFNPWTIPPEEAQFLGTREFTVPQICRWFRMPPHKVADLSRATFSNIEHQALEYVGDTLMPWMVRWEQAVQIKLFTPSETAEGYFVRHLVEGLLRGDIKTRYEAYRIGRNWGWLSADDVRRLEDMNPLPDGQGKKYLIPMNMQDASTLRSNSATEDGSAEPQEKKPPSLLRQSSLGCEGRIQQFKRDAAERISNAELRGLAERIDKAADDRGRFNAWCIGFYTNHKLYVKKTLKPFGFSKDKIADITDGKCKDMLTTDNPIELYDQWKTDNLSIIMKALEVADAS